MSTKAELRRVFSDAKTIDSPALNRAGVQPFRAVVARALYNLRGRRVADPRLVELSRTGIITIEDFLAPAEFSALVRETDDYMATHTPAVDELQGTTEVRHFYLYPVDAQRYPTIARRCDDPEVIDLVAAAERRGLGDGQYSRVLEHLRLGDSSEPDPMTRLHVDTLFHTHKVWLFLEDVGPENAPFVYVPGSHRLDRERLRFDYLDSNAANMRSRLASDEEVARRGLVPRAVTCAANTLVIADTCGYHARSIGGAGATRTALHLSFRANPFALRTGNRRSRVATPSG